MHECAICGAVHAICMCNMNTQYAVYRPVVASHDFHHFQKAAIAKYAPSVCARCIPLKIFFLQTTCLDNMQCAPVLCLTIERFGSFGQLCVVFNGLQWSWSKCTMASSTSSSSPTQPLGPKTMTMIMTGQVKRMQSPCEGLTMLILIFIMMKITQMMIMQG